MTKISEVMVSNPIVAEVPGNRIDVLKKMMRYNLTGLLVVRASDGMLAGVITRKDILNNPDEDQLSLLMRKDTVHVSPRDSVEDAARLMVDNDLHRLPVIDDHTLVGIVTPTDLLKEVKQRKLSIAAEDVISSTCVTAYEGDPLSYLASVFRISNTLALPVLDIDGRLSGILTDRDIFNNSHTIDEYQLTDLGLMDGKEEYSIESMRNVMPLVYAVKKRNMPELFARDIMVPDPTTVFRKTSVSEAAHIMRKNDFGQLPVRDNNDQLLGIIYDLDVVSALVRK
ncbi:MAG: CBS domain-containing protein [Candidatus Methanomethylophilaceae archaeon]|nr:CBS domain-containing protein [Candidatus Methanomethylophilaceae archaeon]